MWRLRIGGRFPDRTVRSDCQCRHPFSGLVHAADEVVLDVRDLPLQGQIGRTLERMEALPAGGRLRHVNTIVPWPLFAMLETRGHRYRLFVRERGDVEVLIWSLGGKSDPDRPERIPA